MTEIKWLKNIKLITMILLNGTKRSFIINHLNLNPFYL